MPAPPPEVFISYSSSDEAFKDALVTHLEVLKLQDVFSNIWHDGLLLPGQQWHQEIVDHLNSSRVILLLISSKFLTSGYVNNVELKSAAERHKAGEVCVIPVLVRNVFGWKEHSFGNLKLGDLQAVPDNEEFLVEFDVDKRDGAFAEISERIQKAVDRLEDVVAKTFAAANLPAPPIVKFVARKGRDDRDIIERLKEELSPPNRQLIALIGEGGVGKTTLAAEAVRALSSLSSLRVVWVSSEKRADFTFSTLLYEIAAQLGEKELSKLAPDKKEETVRTLVTANPTLIVLDNFETVSENEHSSCAAFLSSGLCAAMITSRQSVKGALPIYVDAMKPDEASEFLEKLVSQMSDPAVFSDDVRRRIIQTADARPYVMQWVAAQIDQQAQEPDLILNELSQGKGDAAERVFDRSFNLPQLGDDGRATVLALSLFVPNASREAIAVVAGFEGNLERVKGAITRLRSLQLIKARDGNRRFGIEGLTRSLAVARLDKDEHFDDFRQRFVAYFLEYAEAHAKTTAEDFDALEAEKDNVLIALDVTFETEDWESVIEITDALEGFLRLRGYWDDAHIRGELALLASRRSANESAVARALHNTALIHQNRGNLDEARKLYDESLEIKKQLGNESGIAISLHQLAMLAQVQGEIDEARRLYEQGLEINKQLGNESGIAISLHQLAMLAQVQGEIDEARQLYEQSLEIKKKLGDQSGMAITLHQLAMLAQDQGEIDEARRLYDQSLEINKRLGNQSDMASTLHQLANLAKDQGEIDEARRLYDQSLEIKKRIGDQRGIGSTLHQLATLAQDQGEIDEARRLYDKSLEIKKRLGDQSGIAISLHQLAMLAQDQGEIDEARRLYDESLEINKRLGNQSGIASTLHQLATLSQDQGEIDEARQLYEQSLEIKKQLGNQSGIASTLHQLAMLAQVQGGIDEARRLYDQSLKIEKRLGDQSGMASTLHQLAMLAQDQGEIDEARRLYDQSLEIQKRLGYQSGIATALHQLGRLAELANNRSEAQRLFSEALSILERLGSPDAAVARRSLQRVEGDSS